MIKQALVKFAAAVAALCAGGAAALAVIYVLIYPLDALGFHPKGIVSRMLIGFVAVVTIAVGGGVGSVVHKFVKRRFGAPIPPPQILGR